MLAPTTVGGRSVWWLKRSTQGAWLTHVNGSRVQSVHSVGIDGECRESCDFRGIVEAF